MNCLRALTRAARGLAGALFCALAAVSAAQGPAQKEPEAPTAQNPLTLRMVVWDGEEALVALREAVKGFEKTYPHLKVDLQAVAYESYFSKLLAQYAANIAPDVAMMGPDQFQRFSSKGVLLPLNEFYDDIPGFSIDSYYKEIVDAHSIEGKLYVLPRDIAPITVIYYNKKHFRDAGLPQPTGDWSWDFKIRPELKEKDFLWVLEKLRKKNDKGKTINWGYAPGWQDLWTQTMLYSLGLSTVDDHKAPKRVTIGDPEVRRVIQYSADLALKMDLMPSGVAVASSLETNARAMFTKQKVSMFHSGIWEVPNMRRDLKPGTPGFFDWDIVMAPSFADGRKGFPTGGSGYSVVSQTKHPKEAWLLTQWMAGEPGMTAMAKAGLAQPAISKLAQQEPWIPGPNTPEDQRFPANRIITHTSVPYVKFGISAPYMADVISIMNQPSSLVYDGISPADKELPRFAKIAQDRLDYLLRQESLPQFNWVIGIGIGALLLGALLAWIYAPEFKRPRKRTLKERKENFAGYAFIMPWLIGMLAFTVGPMILSLLMSFADWDIVVPAKWRGFGNFQEAFYMDPTFWPSIKVTVVYTIVSVPLGLIGSLALALLLNTKVWGMPLWRTFYYIPSISSAVAAAMIWRQVFRPKDGLLDTIIFGPEGRWDESPLARLVGPLVTDPGQVNWLTSEKTALASLIVMSLWGVGGGMVIMLAGLQGVPGHYYEAATLDGAGPWRKLVNVTLPLISPTLFFSLITGFIGSFQAFTGALLLTAGGPNNATMFNMLHVYNNAFVGLRMGYASSLAWVLFFIILIFTLVQLYLNKFVHYEGGK